MRKNKTGYRTVPLSSNRHMVAATLDIARNQNNIQAVMEVDISTPRQMMREIKQRTGQSLSLTALIVTALARAISEHPYLNAIRKGGKLILVDNVTVGVLVERNINGELVPDNLGVREAQNKSFLQIQEEIRDSQNQKQDKLGAISGTTWIRFIPSFLFRIFVQIASHNLKMIERYGAVAVTAVGMFGPKNQALWLIPLVGGATVTVAVGGIVERPCMIDGSLEIHEHLCLTVTFNHDIVDGAPAARFLKRFSELLKNGELLDNTCMEEKELHPDEPSNLL